MNQKILILLLLSFCVCSSTGAQQAVLNLISTDSTDIFQSQEIPLGKEEVEDLLDDLIKGFIADNYLEASVDSMWQDSSQQRYFARIHKGPKYDFERIILDSLSSDLLNDLPFERIANKQDLIFLQNHTIQRYADIGYPFSKLRLRSMEIDSSELGGYLIVDKGPMIIVDSIRILGSLKLSEKFIYKYLGIKPHSPYDHSNIRKIGDKLSQLNYLDQYQPADMTFYGNYATVNIYAHENNSSRFDFLFGIIPSTQLENRNLFLSLDITAELMNKFGSGEYFFFDFEKLRPEQQKFELKFNYPYILDLNYALDLNFSIFRNSLDYQTLVSDIGIQYLFNSKDKLKLSWVYESSKLVEIDSTSLFQSAMLPEDLDISQNGISLEIEMQRLDYPFNPQKGFKAKLKASGGIKEIELNNSILRLKNDQLDFSNSYDSLELRTARFEIKSHLFNYIPLASRSCLGTHIQLAWRYSKNGLYRNEKFQIGGNKILRGFDEAQFFSSYYALATLEYKILLNNNSFLSAPFLDFAFLENSQGDNIWAIGLGAGLGIQTKAGQLQFSIAVGRSKELDFDLRRPKAHIGYVSLF